MDDNRFLYRKDDLPFELDEGQWGKFDEAEEICCGVYYVCTEPEDKSCPLGREMYVVTPAAVPAVISPEVAKCGVEAEGVRIFEYTEATDPFNLVKFELLRYRVKHGLPTGEAEGSLYSAAVYNAEYFPWYFGGTIPPRYTPFGLTIRVKKAGEGLFFLETDQCNWVLAVSYPIWSSELSEYTMALGVTGSDSLSTHVEEARYLFFSKERCATAVYELADNQDHKGLRNFIRSQEALETFLWEHFTPYALERNAWEVTGKGDADLLENLLRTIGAPIPEPDDELRQAQENQRVRNCIHYAPELSGQDFLLLP